MCKPVASGQRESVDDSHSDDAEVGLSGYADEAPCKDSPSHLDFKKCMPILIFDWDDTLFPTTSLRKLGPARLRPKLDMIDTCVAHLLRAAAAVPESRVFILTNANISWIYHASEEFLPRVHSFLLSPPQNFQVLSGHQPRESCPPAGTPEYEAEVKTWKKNVLQEQAPALQANLHTRGFTEVQVVSIGDSPHDLEAGALLATQYLQSSRQFVKLVRMHPAPTFEGVLLELRLLCAAFGPMLACPKSFHQVMAPPFGGARTADAQIAETRAAEVAIGASVRKSCAGTGLPQRQQSQEVRPTSNEGSCQEHVPEGELC